MKKIQLKTLLGFGVVATLAASGSAILSCGSSDQNPTSNFDQQRLDAVTTEQVAYYVDSQPGFEPSYARVTPTTAPYNALIHVTLNGLDGITIIIDKWQANVPIQGAVSFDVTLIKSGLKDKTLTNVTYSGWNPKTDQQKLDAVTAIQVADYVKTQPGFVPSLTVAAPTSAPSTTLNNLTLNGINGITIYIDPWF